MNYCSICLLSFLLFLGACSNVSTKNSDTKKSNQATEETTNNNSENNETSTTDPEEAIFRYINIGQDRFLNLGEDISKHTAYLTPKSRQEYQLKGGPFADATQILVLTNVANKITTFKFSYASDTDFDEKVDAYEASLGAASSKDQSKAVWEDQQTKFMVIKDAAGLVTTELMDKKTN